MGYWSLRNTIRTAIALIIHQSRTKSLIVMNSRVIRPKTTCSVFFAKILSVFSIDAAYYKCQNFSFFQRACPPCPPPFWPIHLMAALSVWQYCGSALLIEQISRLRSRRKELECKSEVGRICGQGTKGANQFGRWRD